MMRDHTTPEGARGMILWLDPPGSPAVLPRTIGIPALQGTPFQVTSRSSNMSSYSSSSTVRIFWR
jgi:hypothetical protein